MKVFELNIDNKGNESYLVFVNPVDMFYIKGINYNKKNNYMKLEDRENSFSFLTQKNISPQDLQIFASPKLSSLNLNNTFSEGNKKPSVWILVAVLFGVFLFGIILYLILRKWYKDRYENHLFKNKNNLYNLVVYINGMKKQGVDDKEIAKR